MFMKHYEIIVATMRWERKEVAVAIAASEQVYHSTVGRHAGPGC